MRGWDQFGSDYDFPEFTGLVRSYLIASTPRCGSHYLGHLLRMTGQLGSPLEYFSRARIGDWQSRLSMTSHDDIFRYLTKRRTSPSGWFGVKAHWPQFEHIYSGGSILEWFNFEGYIQIKRSDQVAQAVSLVIAQQTSSWISFQRPRRQPQYDATAIAAALIGINHQLECWERFFEENGLKPLKLSYETTVADPETNVRSVLAYLGLPEVYNPNGLVVMPRRQASPLNEEWANRFRESEIYESVMSP